MSMPPPPAAASACICRLPWALAAVAVMIAGAVLLSSIWRTAPTPAAHDPLVVAPVLVTDESLSTLRHELEETRRVLDDAQSALAQRDREISAANDDLRILREEVATLRAKAFNTPATPP